LRGSVACYHLCLTTNGNQNAAVAKDEDKEYDAVKRQNIPNNVE